MCVCECVHVRARVRAHVRLRARVLAHLRELVRVRVRVRGRAWTWAWACACACACVCVNVRERHLKRLAAAKTALQQEGAVCRSRGRCKLGRSGLAACLRPRRTALVSPMDACSNKNKKAHMLRTHTTSPRSHPSLKTTRDAPPPQGL